MAGKPKEIGRYTYKGVYYESHDQNLADLDKLPMHES